MCRREFGSEKKRIGLEKLNAAFLDDVAVEHIQLAAFRAPYFVQSFRTKKLTTKQRERIDAVHRSRACARALETGRSVRVPGDVSRWRPHAVSAVWRLYIGYMATIRRVYGGNTSALAWVSFPRVPGVGCAG